MFRKKPRIKIDEENDGSRHYSLDLDSSQRWNSQYAVPRNSIADEEQDIETSTPKDGFGLAPQLEHRQRYMFYGQSRRDLDTHGGKKRVLATLYDGPLSDEEGEFSHMTHWLETLSELYMNELDNRARWEPRWLNITRRERFEELSSANITVFDYLDDDTVQRSVGIGSVRGLAAALQRRPEDSAVRVVVVTDLSRLVMGALGHLYSVDPEFWFEHLVQSGYSASDSGLKLKNAVWMNWAERKSRFRHRALPGIGQRTEWNLPRRTRDRSWVHFRWGRLGLFHYLGRKGFHENELDMRLGDGRWLMERDVQLDKYGALITKKRQLKLAMKRKAREMKKKKETPTTQDSENTFERSKMSNVYRPYGTFESIPKNLRSWVDRDLRVMAPEGASYWSGIDGDGKKIIILLFDPTRNMKNSITNKVTPSLTFMPRAMEIAKYSHEELWRVADSSETYLDPPEPPMTAKRLKKQKKDAKKQELKLEKEKTERMLSKSELEPHGARLDDDSILSESSDSDDDIEYEQKLRAQYKNPSPFARDRDFARKYSLATHELVCRYLEDIKTTALLNDTSTLPTILAHLSLDDFWQLLAEMRLDLDRLDDDFGASLHLQLIESIGTTIRQNLYWMRSTLQQLHDWASHLVTLTQAPELSDQPELLDEIETLVKDIQDLQGHVEQSLSHLISLTGIAQSSLVIDQTDGINKLTELAFLFIPLSFITSVFSMQVLEFSRNPPPLWTWGVVLSTVLLVTYLIRLTLRSPSVRVFIVTCRAVILNRFSSPNSASAARQLNTVSNRALTKFFFFFTGVVAIVVAFVCLTLAFMFLVFLGIWLGAAAVALYFIITRWPEASVLIPCFISLPVSAVGMWISWSWYSEIVAASSRFVNSSLAWIRMIFPESWLLDSVEDDDLATEGVNIYARQALEMVT